MKFPMPHSNGGSVDILTPDGVEPADIEVDALVITARTDDGREKLVSLAGRAGLLAWYVENVGYDPDEDIGGLTPIVELVSLVGEMIYLHAFGE